MRAIARRLGCSEAQAWVIVIVVAAGVFLAGIGIPPTLGGGPDRVAHASVPTPAGAVSPPPGSSTGTAARTDLPVPATPVRRIGASLPSPVADAAVEPGAADETVAGAPPTLLALADGTAQPFATLVAVGQPQALTVAGGGDVVVAVASDGGPRLRRYSPDATLQRDDGVGPVEAGRVVAALVDDPARDRLLAVFQTPAEILTIDPASAASDTLLALPDLPLCVPLVVAPPCENGVVDQAPAPSAAALDREGNLYIADPAQATIFRVAASGSAAVPWHQSVDYLTPDGPTGLTVEPGGAVVFTVGSVLDGGLPSGAVYRLAVGADGLPSQRTRLAAIEPALGPGAVAVGGSERLYVALRDADQVLVLDPDGRALRVLGTEDGGGSLPAPAALAFSGTTLLVASAPPDPAQWAVLAVGVGEEVPA